MNGLNFFKIINNRRYEAIKILITLYGNNPRFEDIRKKGIDWLLTKPFSGDEVEAAVINLINSRCIKGESKYVEKQQINK